MDETVENMEETKQEETPTVAPKSVKKTEEEKHLHQVAKAPAGAKMLEQVMPVGTVKEINDIPMVVTKVDGMTVTMKRTDIVG